MSEAVTALSAQIWNDGIASIESLPLQGMITLRGDLGDKTLRSIVKEICGEDVPGPREAKVNGTRGVCWMSPDELLLLCPYEEVAQKLERIAAHMGAAHYLAVDVSDARAMFAVSGAHARDVLAKLAPVDLAKGQFEAPMFRRTRLAQVPAAFWMEGPERFHLICFRSQAGYVFDLLCTAAQAGSEVFA